MEKVRDRSGDPQIVLGQDGLKERSRKGGRPTGRSGMGWGTLGEVWNGSGDSRDGPEWISGPSGRSEPVGGPLGRFGTGRGTLWEVWDGSRTTGSCRTCRGNLPMVRDGLGDPWGGPDRSKDLLKGPGLVGRPTKSSGTGQGTLAEGKDGSEDRLGDPGRVGGPSGKSEDGLNNLGNGPAQVGDPQKVPGQDGGA